MLFVSLTIIYIIIEHIIIDYIIIEYIIIDNIVFRLLLNNAVATSFFPCNHQDDITYINY